MAGFAHLFCACCGQADVERSCKDPEPIAQELSAHPQLPASQGPAEDESPGASGRTTSAVLPLVPSESSALQSKLQVPFSELTFHAQIGKGSFKQVYRGKWNNTIVAIVAMRRGGLVTEARLMQQLGAHPNLVQFYRWSADARGNEYVVVELVSLGSLDKVLRQFGRSLRNRSKLSVCEQICHAMCELAAEGVLHRDLAARNILVQSMQPVHVKVADFGLARVAPNWDAEAAAAGGDAEIGPGASAGLAADGAVAGGDDAPLVPVRWSAPEVLRSGGGWSEKSDVYSYGVTMWEIFSDGAEPYASKSNEEAATAVAAGELLPRPKNCPQPVYSLMLDCWRQDPSQRPSFRQIADVYRRWREATLAAKAVAAAAAAGSGSGGGGAFGSSPDISPPPPGALDNELLQLQSRLRAPPAVALAAAAVGGGGGPGGFSASGGGTAGSASGGYIPVAAVLRATSSPPAEAGAATVGGGGGGGGGCVAGGNQLQMIPSGEVLSLLDHRAPSASRLATVHVRQLQSAAARPGATAVPAAAPPRARSAAATESSATPQGTAAKRAAPGTSLAEPLDTVSATGGAAATAPSLRQRGDGGRGACCGPGPGDPDAHCKDGGAGGAGAARRASAALLPSSQVDGQHTGHAPGPGPSNGPGVKLGAGALPSPERPLRFYRDGPAPDAAATGGAHSTGRTIPAMLLTPLRREDDSKGSGSKGRGSRGSGSQGFSGPGGGGAASAGALSGGAAAADGAAVSGLGLCDTCLLSMEVETAIEPVISASASVSTLHSAVLQRVMQRDGSVGSMLNPMYGASTAAAADAAAAAATPPARRRPKRVSSGEEALASLRNFFLHRSAHDVRAPSRAGSGAGSGTDSGGGGGRASGGDGGGGGGESQPEGRAEASPAPSSDPASGASVAPAADLLTHEQALRLVAAPPSPSITWSDDAPPSPPPPPRWRSVPATGPAPPLAAPAATEPPPAPVEALTLSPPPAAPPARFEATALSPPPASAAVAAAATPVVARVAPPAAVQPVKPRGSAAASNPYMSIRNL